MTIMCGTQLKFVINYLLLILPHYGAVWQAGNSHHQHWVRPSPWQRLDDQHFSRSYLYRAALAPGLSRRQGTPQTAVTVVAQSQKQSDTTSAVAMHSAWAQLEWLECGESAADRIIGGTNAALGQFPWLVRLGYTSPVAKQPEWLCGGALITARYVVTAGHCTVDKDNTFTLTTVRLGEYNINTDPDCQLGVCAPQVQDSRIKRTITHPQFKEEMFHNDIAMLELETPVVLHDYVSPICLPRNPQNSQLRLGEPLTVAGWGKMNMSTEERAEIVQVVQVPLVPSEACDHFGRGFKMTPGELCAGAQLNKDACGGDSGGPLMKVYDTAEGPKTFLVGVVSFGPTICGIKKPGVYSSVPHFLGWILDNII